MSKRIIKFSIHNKHLVMPVADLFFMMIALWVALSMRLGEWYRPMGEQWWLFIAAPVVALPIFVRMGFYRAVVRYMESKALWMIVQAVSLSVLIWATVIFLSGIMGAPRSVVFIYWFTCAAAIGGSRMAIQWVLAKTSATLENQKRVLIYGAGDTGIQLAGALRYGNVFSVVGFVDDAPEKIGTELGGLRVYGPLALEGLIRTKGVQLVLLATPSATVSQRRRIIERLECFPVSIRIIPSMVDLALGRVQQGRGLGQIEIEDLLGRDPVPPDAKLLAVCIRGKSVMVTGAGGSIGSALCRQILYLSPKRLVFVEREEAALYRIKMALIEMLKTANLVDSCSSMGQETEIVDILGSVLHQKHMENVCKTYGVETIYHSAAYKHVPMAEDHPVEAVYNNVIGTLRLAQAAMASGVETFMLLSTDKAVCPTNVMGATKRFAELILQGLSAKRFLESVDEVQQRTSSNTKFSMVRFGNVLDTSGSVVPLFYGQINKGGPVTVTHENVSRYFMTMPEAVQLTIQAGTMARGGDVFILDMGDPVKILDLAKRMISLAGKQVKGDSSAKKGIEIKIVGLRRGEKLHEELVIGNNVSSTVHPKIKRAKEAMLPWSEVKHLLKNLEMACKNDNQDHVKMLLRKAVYNYRSQSNEINHAFCNKEGR
jgi:FlaA1/EpsC-like NDP-sugar epimerase